MELKEIEYILTIANEGSITKAAQKLYMAQSSLSQFLSKIETELKTVIFVRTSSGVRPTYSGEILINDLKDISTILNHTKNKILDIEFLKAGKIQFGISTFRGSYLLPQVLKEFSKQYPYVEIVITENDSKELNKKILNGELDFALVAADEKYQKTADKKHIMKDEVLLITDINHPINSNLKTHNGYEYVDIEDIKDFEFFLSPQGTILGDTAYDLFNSINMKPRVINDTLTAFFAVAMAQTGLGLAFTYNSCKKNDTNSKYIRIGKEGYFVDLVLIYPPEGYKSHATKSLSKMIINFFEQ